MLLGNVGHVHPDYPRRRSTGAGADQGDDRGGRQDGAEDLAARAEAEGGAVEDQHQTGEDPGAGQAAEAGTAAAAVTRAARSPTAGIRRARSRAGVVATTTRTASSSPSAPPDCLATRSNTAA